MAYPPIAAMNKVNLWIQQSCSNQTQSPLAPITSLALRSHATLPRSATKDPSAHHGRV